MGKCKKKYSEKDEKDYIAAQSRFFNLSLADGSIMVRVLESLSDFYKEGKLLHHCVFSNACLLYTSREVPNVGGIAAVIMRSFGIAETTSFFRRCV